MLQAGAVEYSQNLSQARLRWRFWQKIVYYKGRCFHNKEYLTQVSQYLAIISPFLLDYNQCIEKLKSAKAIYFEMKQTHQ